MAAHTTCGQVQMPVDGYGGGRAVCSEMHALDMSRAPMLA